jgi:hypothetical protein
VHLDAEPCALAHDVSEFNLFHFSENLFVFALTETFLRHNSVRTGYQTRGSLKEGRGVWQ